MKACPSLEFHFAWNVIGVCSGVQGASQRSGPYPDVAGSQIEFAGNDTTWSPSLICVAWVGSTTKSFVQTESVLFARPRPSRLRPPLSSNHCSFPLKESRGRAAVPGDVAESAHAASSPAAVSIVHQRTSIDTRISAFHLLENAAVEHTAPRCWSAVKPVKTAMNSLVCP